MYEFGILSLNDKENIFFQYFKSTPVKREYSKNILMLPLQNDFSAMRINFKASNEIIKSFNYSIRFFYVGTPVDTFALYQNANKLRRQFYYFKYKFELFKICRIYNINISHVIGSNFHNFKKLEETYVKNKTELLKIRYKGILIGDLIYDHYLRFYSKPTVELDDLRLQLITSYSFKLVDYWYIVFNNANIKAVSIPYTSYLHWGIIARVGLKVGVDIFNYGSPLYMFQKLDKEHIYHTKNYKRYNKIWNKLENKEKCLKLAEISLNNRLEGGISDISYMKISSFVRTSQNIITTNSRNNIVIFLHCFFDSPHIYGGGLFVDFYEWLDFLLNTASRNSSVTYFVKQHPNGVEGNFEVVESFKKKYSEFSNIVFLDIEVSNLDIQDLKPSLIVTYYGTVAQEFSYLGFPVVLCGDSPMKYYGFTYQPEKISELEEILQNVGDIKLPMGYDKEEILEFYYMHYLYYSRDLNASNFQFSKNFISGELSFTHYDQFRQLLF
ncbi:MAG: hypothetical protein RIT38_13 [Bacteroidota bacterium]|jgi:hypothetical protein